jgi:hypothetical protein
LTSNLIKRNLPQKPFDAPSAQILLLPVPGHRAIMETSNPPPHAQKSMVKSLIAYSIVCVLVIAVVASLRFYIRLRVIRKFGHDDAALAATVVRTPFSSPVPTLISARVPREGRARPNILLVRVSLCGLWSHLWYVRRSPSSVCCSTLTGQTSSDKSRAWYPFRRPLYRRQVNVAQGKCGQHQPGPPAATPPG